MKILFDQGTPAPLRRALPEHEVILAADCGWSNLSNGDLLSAAESAGFTLLVTTDQNLRYQQNLTNRRIGIIVLKTTSWPRIRADLPRVIAEILALPHSGYREISL